MIQVDRQNLDSAKPNDGEFITIFTDGSHCPHTNAWGVGIWIRYKNEHPIQFTSGGCGEYNNAFDVECHGIRIAFEYILKNYDTLDTIVVIQCDNIGALNRVVNTYKQRLILAGVRYVKPKHVKAHTTHNTKRSKVNEIVDGLARKQMEKYR